MRSAPMLAMLAVLVSPTPAQQDAAGPPNVVLFLIDDLGWRDVGFLGSEFYETPSIDRLAGDAMVFVDAYANGPNCAPSRACLMSGQYGPRHGVYTVGNPARGQARHRKLIPIANRTELPESTTTLAEALRAAGYATGHFGKWHLGADPRTQGFDVNVAGNATGSPRGGHFSPYQNPQLPDGPKREYLTDRLTDEAVRFVRAHRDGPFFLYLTHYAVHTPIQSKPELQDKYRRKPKSHGQGNARYAAMIESVDDSVGAVLDELAALGLRDRTLVIFTSDNGGYGPATSMKPLRGSKGMLYEGGIRVPLAISWPGVVPAGSRCDVPVVGVDLYPTILELIGSEPAADQVLDGRSLVPLLTVAGPVPERALFWHFPAYLQAYRRTAGDPWRTTPAGAIRSGPWKLLEFFEDGRLELYHLDDDPGERHDLSAARPEITRDLHDQLRRWRAATAAPVPTERNPKYDPGR